MRRSDVSKPYRFCNADAIYSSVSDGVVFGVHVDTGVDFAFPAYTKDSLCAKQTICTGDLHYPCGYHCFYRNYLYQGGGIFRPDAFAILVFHIFVDCGIAVYASDNGG